MKGLTVSMKKLLLIAALGGMWFFHRQRKARAAAALATMTPEQRAAAISLQSGMLRGLEGLEGRGGFFRRGLPVNYRRTVPFRGVMGPQYFGRRGR